jgi:NAD-dependent DNA ligase
MQGAKVAQLRSRPDEAISNRRGTVGEMTTITTTTKCEECGAEIYPEETVSVVDDDGEILLVCDKCACLDTRLQNLSHFVSFLLG